MIRKGPVGATFLGLLMPLITIVSDFYASMSWVVFTLIILFLISSSQTYLGFLQIPSLRTAFGLNSSLSGTIISTKPPFGTELFGLQISV